MDVLFNIEEIAAFLGISVKATRNRLSVFGITKTKTVDRRALFCADKVAQLKLTYVDRRKAKVKETYITIESKLNSPD